MFERTFAQVEQQIGELFGLTDPELICFLISFVDGLIWQQIYGCKVDYAKQGELLSTMLTAYLEEKAWVLQH